MYSKAVRMRRGCLLRRASLLGSGDSKEEGNHGERGFLGEVRDAWRWAHQNQEERCDLGGVMDVWEGDVYVEYTAEPCQEDMS